MLRGRLCFIMEMIKEVLKNIKEYLVPLIAGVLLFPLKSIFEFKGIIYNEPAIVKNSILEIEFVYNNSEVTDSLVVKLMLLDTSAYSQDFKRAAVVDRIPSDVNFEESSEQYFIDDRRARAVFIPRLDQGEYRFIIPVIERGGEPAPNLVSYKNISLRFVKQSGNNIEFEEIVTRPYRFYYFLFFHPWVSFVILVALGVGFQFIIKKKKVVK